MKITIRIPFIPDLNIREHLANFIRPSTDEDDELEQDKKAAIKAVKEQTKARIKTLKALKTKPNPNPPASTT